MDGSVGGSWEVKSASDFETIWWDMEKIEPLTPVTQSKKDASANYCEMLW